MASASVAVTMPFQARCGQRLRPGDARRQPRPAPRSAPGLRHRQRQHQHHQAGAAHLHHHAPGHEALRRPQPGHQHRAQNQGCSSCVPRSSAQVAARAPRPARRSPSASDRPHRRDASGARVDASMTAINTRQWHPSLGMTLLRRAGSTSGSTSPRPIRTSPPGGSTRSPPAACGELEGHPAGRHLPGRRGCQEPGVLSDQARIFAARLQALSISPACR